MRKVHFLLHSAAAPPGYLSIIYPEARHYHLYKSDPLPDIKEGDLIFSVGGEMHVDDQKKYPFLKPELKFIEKCLKNKITFTGICLGSELLAKVLGARVRRGGCHERGWHKIKFATGEEHIMFCNHQDTSDVPNGASSIATGDVCKIQGFTFGQAFGMQFHANTMEETVLKISQEPVKRPYPGIDSKEDLIAGLKFVNGQHAWLKNFCASLSQT